MMSHMHWPYLCQKQEADKTVASWAYEQNVLYLLAFPAFFGPLFPVKTGRWLHLVESTLSLTKKTQTTYQFQQGPSATRVE